MSNKCSLCGKNVKEDHQTINCKTCQNKSHASCNGISSADYAALSAEDNADMECLQCLFPKIGLAEISDNTTPAESQNNQILNLKSFLRELNDVVDFPDMLERDAGVEVINCRYYGTDEFQALDPVSRIAYLFFI